MKKLPKSLFVLSALLTVLTAYADKFTASASLSSRTVAAGEVVDVIFTMNRRPEEPQLPKLENGQWLTNRRQEDMLFNDLNGVRTVTYMRTIGIRTEKEGTLEIPSVSFKSHGETAATKPLTVKVLPPGQSAPAAKEARRGAARSGSGISGFVSIPGGRTSYYVGEEIPVEATLLISPRAGVRRIAYPEITGVPNAVFSDFPNPENRRFAEPRRRETVIDGERYLEIVFPTALRVMKAGRIAPGAVCTVGVVRRDRSGRHSGFPFDDDDFFGGVFSGFGQEPTPYEVKFREPKEIVEIKPLPPAPAGAYDLRLVGNWKLSARLSSLSARVGEPAELIVTLSGDASGESVRAPELKFDGFRVYPPEVKKSFGNVEIRYVLIPLSPGKKQLHAQFAVFAPSDGKYRTGGIALDLDVLPGSAPAAAAAVREAGPAPKAEKQSDEAEAEAKTPPRETPFWQKSRAGDPVLLPLWRNQLIWILLCLVGGPAIGILAEFSARRRAKLARDPEFSGRCDRARRLPAVLKTISRADFDDAKLRAEVVPFLAEAKHLAPGTTATELAETIDDPELKQFFLESGAAGFRPEGASDSDRKTVSPEIRRKLVKLLKRSLALLLIAAALPAAFAAKTLDNSAFGRGDFRRAAADCQTLLAETPGCPELLYNLGGAAWQLDDLPLARWALERALLLAPGDDETRENLNLVNRKLLQPEVGNFDTPGEFLASAIGRLRPDHYLLIASAAFALLCIGAGFRRSFPRSWRITGGALLAVVMIGALGALWSECRGAYDCRRAIVTAPKLELRSLPTSGAGKVEAVIPGGASALILDRGGDWVRVLVNGRDGWAKKSEISPLLPEGVFGGDE